MTSIREELTGKRILVTGAAGFIGSRLVKELLKNEAVVVGVVDVKANLSRLSAVLNDPRLHLVHSSLTHVDYLADHVLRWGNIDLLAHLGLFVPRNQSYPEQAINEIRMNLAPTLYLTRILGDSPKGICFASSLSVYGRQTELPVRETTQPLPVSAYGVTKLAIESYLRAYGEANQIPVTILRYATVYGPGEFGYRAIPNFLNSIAEGNQPRVYGDGMEKRDYVYIDDVVDATVRALATRPSGVFNIGSGQSYTSMEIAREVLRLYPSDIEPVMVAKDQPNMDLIGDISAAKEILDYAPQTNLEDGLKQEIEWFKQQDIPLAHEAGKKEPEISEKQGVFRSIFSYRFWSGICNRILSFLALAVLSPLLLLIAIGIKLDSRESPIFAQERVGKDGTKFTAYKFRS
ncbi:MAG: NAD-dependent epimerase/dehydratase family protein, partial [Dehalococcoidia bacterium]